MARAQRIILLTDPRLQGRFWSKVNKDGPTIRPELGPCWIWVAGKFSNGYGIMRVNGKSWLAHKLAWILSGAEIPDNLNVLHRCDNRPCCRPSHLFTGTQKMNMQDMIQKGRGGDTRVFGDRSGARLHPERYPRGANHRWTKLTLDKARRIRIEYEWEHPTFKAIACRFGICKETARLIILGRMWPEP